MRNKKLLTLIGSVCLILVLAAMPFMSACAPAEVTPPPEEEEGPPPEEEGPPKPTGELVIGVPSLGTMTFHPFWAATSRKAYYELMFDFLVGADEDGNLEPGIATKWEEAADHLSYTFWIRDGVKFHDGTPLTLEDVKFSLDTILAERNIVARTAHAPFQDRVEIVPPDKVVIYLKKPWPVMLYQLGPGGQGGGCILPKKYLEEVGDQFEFAPIGTGPYKFVEKKEADFIKYEAAWDYHWRIGIPKYKYITFKMMPELGSRAAAVMAGDLDVTVVDRTKARELKAAGFPIVKKSGAIKVAVGWGMKTPPDTPLLKKEVRQALVYAIDKAAILEHILMGEGELAGTGFFRTWDLCYPEEGFPLTPYDPEKAKELLAEAGYPDGFTIWLYCSITTVPETVLIAEAVAGYWEAIGIDVKIFQCEISTYYEVKTGRKPPQGPWANVSTIANTLSDVWVPLLHSDPKYIYSQVQDPRMDELLELFDVAFTLDKLCKAQEACEEYILSQFYASAFFFIDELFATGKEVPSWNPGRGNNSFRYEYIGATK